jgi:type VI secretion system secreted protein VgrG
MARGHYSFGLEAGAHGERELSVTRFVGTEALSAPYLFEVDFFPVSGEPLDLEALLAKAACLRVCGSDAERAFHGVISAARFLGRKKGRWQYRVEISPRLALLELVTRSRTFLDLSVPQIVKQVLDAGKVKQRWDVRGSYPTRECTAQYRESDLAFASRLMEQEGIWYRFEQGDDGATMVVADGRHGFAETGERLPFRQKDAAAADEDHLYELSRRARRVPGKVVLRDYDFERPMLDLTVSAEEGKGEELYEYPGGYTDPADGKRLARVRLEELRFPLEIWSGRGWALGLAAGRLFEVRGHPQQDWDQKLVAVRVTHAGLREEGAGAAVTHYETSFFGMAASRPYRPLRRTARPEVHGHQRATVVGPEGEEIHTDQHGRVKLAFHWNDGKDELPRSGWVRVLQSMAGPGFGAFFLPRIGQEVLVSYQGGDPDRPAVVGAVYHAGHPPAVELPKDKTQSTLRTASSPYSGGFNELLFEDATGSERIFVHAQKDKNIEVREDKDQRVGGIESLTVAKDRSQEIGGNQSLEVKADDSGAVGGNRTLAVVGDRTTSVDGDHAETVGLAQTVTVKGEQSVFVAKAANVTVGAAAALSVGAAYLVNVGVDHNTLVGGARLEEVGGFKGEVVGLHREERLGGDKTLTVKGDVAEQVDGSVTRRTEGDEEQVAERIELTVAELAQLAARGISIKADTFTVVVGGNVMLKMEKSGRAQLFGKTISVDGQAIRMRGGQIKKIAPGPPVRAVTSRDAASVEIVVNDRDGRPVPREPIRVEFPDGVVQQRVTDTEGRARVVGTKQGRCALSLSRLDAGLWTPRQSLASKDAAASSAAPRVVHARADECVTSIAWANGLDWRAVWNHTRNKELRATRPNPNILVAGDTVFVPEKRIKSVSVETGRTYEIEVSVEPVPVHFRLVDENGPRAGRAYSLDLDDGTRAEGKTDGAGHIELRASPWARGGTLRVEGEHGQEVHGLRLGHLDPVSEVAGVQQRLQNLGLLCEVTGEIDEETRVALRQFQSRRGLEATGEAEPGTRDELVKAHGA